MTTQVNYKGEKYLLIKGASEYILNSCKHIHFWHNDDIGPMNEGVKLEIKQAIHKMAKDTLRTLCIAYKTIDRIPEN